MPHILWAVGSYWSLEFSKKPFSWSMALRKEVHVHSNRSGLVNQSTVLQLQQSTECRASPIIVLVGQHDRELFFLYFLYPFDEKIFFFLLLFIYGYE